LGKQCVHSSIAVDIPIYFGLPEFGAGCRWLEMLGATMPEAAVDENREALFGEYDIGFSWQSVVDTVTASE